MQWQILTVQSTETETSTSLKVNCQLAICSSLAWLELINMYDLHFTYQHKFNLMLSIGGQNHITNKTCWWHIVVQIFVRKNGQLAANGILAFSTAFLFNSVSWQRRRRACKKPTIFHRLLLCLLLSSGGSDKNCRTLWTCATSVETSQWFWAK